jgi:fructosamine-3-kinase
VEDWAPVRARIAEATGRDPGALRARTQSGGCIHRAFVLEGGDARYFVKSNTRDHLEAFVAEAEGLRALARAGAVRVPAPVCWGTAGGTAYLVLEHLVLESPGPEAQEALGRRLAALHRVTHARFGWERDNTIGLTPQPNAWSDDWARFFRDRRLGFQLARAARQGHRRLAAAGERLLSRVEALLRGHAPPASLLHGDLWSGNVAQLPGGEPVLFDPAVYYGDREADLAMTELFGRFDARFYRAYREAWPLAPGYETRRDLYNLYHVLNHVNLFGDAYLAQAERLIGRLLAQAQ